MVVVVVVVGAITLRWGRRGRNDKNLEGLRALDLRGRG